MICQRIVSMVSILSPLYPVACKAIFSEFQMSLQAELYHNNRSKYRCLQIFYMNWAVLCKKGQKGIKETDGMPQKRNSSFLNRLFHNMKECGILSKKEALIYWLCGLSPFCACDIIRSNPRCIDQTHYTPPPPLEHRRQMPAMILFRQNRNPSPAKTGEGFCLLEEAACPGRDQPQ